MQAKHCGLMDLVPVHFSPMHFSLLVSLRLLVQYVPVPGTTERSRVGSMYV